jgi:hypothetical protein
MRNRPIRIRSSSHSLASEKPLRSLQPASAARPPAAGMMHAAAQGAMVAEIKAQ